MWPKLPERPTGSSKSLGTEVAVRLPSRLEVSQANARPGLSGQSVRNAL